MFVWEVAKNIGVSFEQVRECFLVDYTEEDAERFWNSKWSDVQDTFMYFAPLYQLFKGAL